MSDPGSMLPRTATTLAQALDLLENRLFELPVEMITKDPFRVPLAWLDRLAWEASVDVWDPDWPEAVKRNVIAASAEVHRYKGTPHAIKTALAAFDIDADLLEWWQPDGVAANMEPGTFQVTAYVETSLYDDSTNPLNDRMLHAMTSVVHRVSPVSRGLIFRLGQRFRSRIALRAGTATRLDARVVHDVVLRPHRVQVSHPVRAASRASLLSRAVMDFEPRPHRVRMQTGLRAGLQAHLMSRIIHDNRGRSDA